MVVDPESAAGKEYALFLDSARALASGSSSGATWLNGVGAASGGAAGGGAAAARPAPLFGIGIFPAGGAPLRALAEARLLRGSASKLAAAREIPSSWLGGIGATDDGILLVLIVLLAGGLGGAVLRRAS